MKHLILGGVRSGKSAFAEQCAADYSDKVTYIATTQIWRDESGKAFDESLVERIKRHKKRRPSHWALIEEPIELAATIRDVCAKKGESKHVILVECCSLWISNLLCEEPRRDINQSKKSLLETVSQIECDLIFVSSEVGLGVMPMNKLAREFSDELGSLNQEIAQIFDKVTLVAAGLPLHLKG